MTYELKNHDIDPLYYERMAASLGDKVSMLPFVREGLVLDVGCGGGELGAAIQELVDNVEVVGIDPFPYPDSAIPVLEGYADEIRDLTDKAPSTIIACSVMHEVFSYGNRDEIKGSREVFENTLQSFFNALEPGGVLIVRDGVRQVNALEKGFMKFTDPSDDVWVERFIQEFPFIDELNAGTPFRKVSEGVWEANRAALTEFAFTYTWGLSSWPREINEWYTAFSAENYQSVAERVGFVTDYIESYVQQGYKTHLLQKLSFTFDFPPSNALYVFRKPKDYSYEF